MDPPTFSTSNIDSDDLIPEGQPIKRKRLTQACDACRKKKVKCSGDKPACNNCTRLGTTCTYLPSTRKRGPRVGLVESLEKRLQQMEKLLQPLKEQGIVDDAEDKKQSKKPRLSSSNPESNIFRDSFTSNVFNNNNSNEQQPQQSSFDRTEFINIFSQSPQEQKQSQHEQTSNVDRSSEEEDDVLLFFGNSSISPGFYNQKEMATPEPPVNSENSSSTDSNDSIEEIPTPITAIISSKSDNGLPPDDIVQHLFVCFFNHIDVQVSMFHKATLLKQLRQNKVSPFLVYAICAVGARFSNHQSIVHKFRYMSGQPFAAIALKKYLFGTFDCPSVEHVQGLILIALHMFGMGKGPRAWMFTGMAVRMAQELGLHKIDEGGARQNTEALFIQQEMRRRVFWAAFRLDRFAACAHGRPTLIDEDDCDVRLPCNEAIWGLEHPFESQLINEIFKEDQVKYENRLNLSNMGLGACLVSVTALLGRVCHHVNRSEPSNALPPWDSNSQFAVLENELETWYKSLTPHYTYTKERVRQLMADGAGTVFTLIHLLYYVSIVVLNRPNIAPLQNNEVMECHKSFMCASVKRCSDAAGKISCIAEDIIHNGSFICPFSIYPVFITTSIHLNNTCSPVINIAEDAKKYLHINEQYLKLMEPYWAMASKLLYVIDQMKKVHDMSVNERDSLGRILMDTNRVNNNNIIEQTNLDNISSIIVPEQLLSPRWFNDTPLMGDTWTSFLRSPGPFSPGLSRLIRKENDNSNQDNSYDYFSQDLTTYNTIQAPTTFVYDGYPIDMPSDWPTTAGRVFPLNRPTKHWTSINGNVAIEDTSSIPASTTYAPSLANSSSTGDINIGSLLT